MSNTLPPPGATTERLGKPARGRRVLKFLLALIAIPLLVLAALALAALTFALLPVQGRLQQAAGEPAVYLCASLAHTDIVLPSRDPLIDWGGLFPEVVPADLPPQVYLAFGWGDLRFFRETPRWADVKLSTVAGALLGQHDTALRIVAINPPAGKPGCLSLQIDRAGRQALIGHIQASLLRDGSGQPQYQPGGTGLEAYYLAKDRYGPQRTCNQWASEALGAAGLPHARFAPFSFSVTWPLSSRATSRPRDGQRSPGIDQ